MIPASGSVRRVALCIQYDGTNYCGWQRQRNARAKPSVQGVLEAALRSLDPSIGSCLAAGRTDAGVHAAGQVVHFDTAGPVPDQRWARALNGRLPPTIRVNAAQGVPQGWHACFSALSRRYRYTVYNGRAPNLFLSAWSWHRYQVWIDDGAMATALNGLLGEHDFRAFQRSGSRRAHARTTIQEVDVQRHGDLLTVEIQASGFLYGMVRLLMAQLVSVGEGRLSPEAFDRRWREGHRDEVREAAPPQGLCLLRVGYPSPVFSEPACYDGQPRFQLEARDPPPPATRKITLKGSGGQPLQYLQESDEANDQVPPDHS